MEKLAFTLGRPFSPLYSLAMRARELCYQRGFFATHHMGAPVISVGNLLMGGTGKTPLVQYLARSLSQSGWKPAIISRGYGGEAQNRINIVSDGEKLLLEANQAGDEPRFLAETLPGIPVLTGVVRRLPARRALDMGANLLLLDDGFQHLPIKRDVDLVLFNADKLAGNSRVFPGGELREPISALFRATAFILTAVTRRNKERAELFAELLQKKFPGRPVYLLSYNPSAAVQLGPDDTRQVMSLHDLPQGPAFAFCGIARPEVFFQTLRQQGVDTVKDFPLRDHQPYSQRLISTLINQAQSCNAHYCITTEKDLVKLGSLSALFTIPLLALRMEVEHSVSFNEFILNTIAQGPLSS